MDEREQLPMFTIFSLCNVLELLEMMSNPALRGFSWRLNLEQQKRSLSQGGAGCRARSLHSNFSSLRVGAEAMVRGSVVSLLWERSRVCNPVKEESPGGTSVKFLPTNRTSPTIRGRDGF